MTETEIRLTTFETALGAVHVASSAGGIVRLSLPGAPRERVVTWIGKHVPDARIVEGEGRDATAVAQVQEYLAGRRRGFELALDLRGTPFQLDVWRALREVPYGTTISYAELVARAGHPGAFRACGMANHTNPVPLIVPCHRVVASDGSLGGFAGGRALKQRLLALESGQGYLV